MAATWNKVYINQAKTFLASLAAQGKLKNNLKWWEKSEIAHLVLKIVVK